MVENKTFIQRAKEWWKNNKKIVMTGVVFGALGASYGFINGVAATNQKWMEHGFETTVRITGHVENKPN